MPVRETVNYSMACVFAELRPSTFLASLAAGLYRNRVCPGFAGALGGARGAGGGCGGNWRGTPRLWGGVPLQFPRYGPLGPFPVVPPACAFALSPQPLRPALDSRGCRFPGCRGWGARPPLLGRRGVLRGAWVRPQ